MKSQLFPVYKVPKSQSLSNPIENNKGLTITLTIRLMYKKEPSIYQSYI